MTTFYLLPHFDDEIFLIPKIRQDQAENKKQKFIFFMESENRSAESIKFLSKLGVPLENIIFLGNKFNAPDGSLLNYLSKFYDELSHHLESLNEKLEIVCPAYEGGHHDHDAISILGRVLAKKFEISCFEFFMYHGYGIPGKLYFVSSHLPGIEKQTIRYTFQDFFNLVRIPFTYRSQVKAMLGLWPFLIFKAVSSQLVLRIVKGDSLGVERHSETPMYERWERITELNFINTLKNFPPASSLFKN